MTDPRDRQADDILVFGGGIIPEADIPGLKALGVTEVFGPGTPLPVIVEWVGAHVPDHDA